MLRILHDAIGLHKQLPFLYGKNRIQKQINHVIEIAEGSAE